MRIGKIIGTVTLNRSHPLLVGATYHIAVPQPLANLTGESKEVAEELVLYDELGAGLESIVAISEGREAAQPFYPQMKPIDAYNAAILDNVEVGGKR
ncbi:MAG: carbon dioxide concentrating mechanism protein CcmL [Pirellulales bacterium]|nr:carbon dioxide concentrating mechanism protein CcmL [Pirellulales bacterium]